MKTEKISEEEYLQKCLEVLDYFRVDYTKDIIKLTDGGNSCIMNPNSEFYELFGGYSVNSIIEYVAKKLNKKVKWISD
ncbi:hypothetical protein M0P65_06155 [Candidatus Gracilibacteria bacterium]|jgi:hypothetical protein|nr:hypothetical protein [Candidatus Gracilibacteria bacterium]